MAERPLRRPGGYRGVACPICKRSLRHESLISGTQVCPYCRGAFEAVHFTPAETKVTVAQLGEAGPDAAAPCARHGRNAAVAACERCGSFICELCKIEADGKILCPPCFERLSAEGELPSAVVAFRDYGLVAQTWAMFGIVFGFVFGPLALVYGLKGLKQKKRMGESRGVVWTYVCMVLGVLEFVVQVFLIVLLAMAMLGAFD